MPASPALSALVHPLAALAARAPLSTAAAWLLTYALHSTVLLAAAWLAARRLRGRYLGLEEAIWRVAMVGGLVTATAQLALASFGSLPAAGRIQLAAALANPPAAAARSGVPEPSLIAAASAAERESAAPSSAANRGSNAVNPGASGVVVSSSAAALESTGANRAGAAFRATLPAPCSTAAAPRPPAPHGWLAKSGGASVAAVGAALRRVAGGWTIVLVAGWLLCGTLLSAAFLRSYLALRARLRYRPKVVGGDIVGRLARLVRASGISRPVHLTCTWRLRVPVALGGRPAELCVPPRVLFALSEEHQDALLAHELGHLVRRDPFWLVAIQLLACALFFQPLNWLTRRRLRELSELLCDEWAVARTGRPLSLAACLTEVAGWSLGGAAGFQRLDRLPVPSMASRSSELARRIRRLLDRHPADSHAPSPRNLLIVLAAVLLAVTVAAPGFSVVDTPSHGTRTVAAVEPTALCDDAAALPAAMALPVAPASPAAPASPGADPSPAFENPSQPMAPSQAFPSGPVASLSSNFAAPRALAASASPLPAAESSAAAPVAPPLADAPAAVPVLPARAAALSGVAPARGAAPSAVGLVAAPARTPASPAARMVAAPSAAVMASAPAPVSPAGRARPEGSVRMAGAPTAGRIAASSLAPVGSPASPVGQVRRMMPVSPSLPVSAAAARPAAPPSLVEIARTWREVVRSMAQGAPGDGQAGRAAAGRSGPTVAFTLAMLRAPGAPADQASAAPARPDSAAPHAAGAGADLDADEAMPGLDGAASPPSPHAGTPGDLSAVARELAHLAAIDSLSQERAAEISAAVDRLSQDVEQRLRGQIEELNRQMAAVQTVSPPLTPGTSDLADLDRIVAQSMPSPRQLREIEAAVAKLAKEAPGLTADEVEHLKREIHQDIKIHPDPAAMERLRADTQRLVADITARIPAAMSPGDREKLLADAHRLADRVHPNQAQLDALRDLEHRRNEISRLLDRQRAELEAMHQEIEQEAQALRDLARRETEAHRVRVPHPHPAPPAPAAPGAPAAPQAAPGSPDPAPPSHR